MTSRAAAEGTSRRASRARLGREQHTGAFVPSRPSNGLQLGSVFIAHSSWRAGQISRDTETAIERAGLRSPARFAAFDTAKTGVRRGPGRRRGSPLIYGHICL